MDIRQEIYELSEELIEIRRRIHRYPELGTEEHRTSAMVEKYLRDLGIEVRRAEHAFNTGLIATIYGGYPGKTILLRADMDALPMSEENDLEFRSEVPGCMHSCGHDCHTAMLMLAAKVLQKHRDELHGNVRLVFEPNEEVAGAIYMVQDGALKDPDVDASFAMHVNGLIDVGQVGISYGAFFGEDDNFDITIKGVSGHTSAPQDCIDPIICASAIVQQTQIIQTRQLNPMDTTVILFGSIHGGTTYNIVPDEVKLQGTIRYLYKDGDDTPQKPRVRFEQLIQNIAATYGCQASVEYEVSAHVLINDSDFMGFLNKKVIPKVETIHEQLPMVTLAGEDFCEYVNRNNIPGAMIFLGVGNREKGIGAPLHSPDFLVDERALPIGVELHVRTAMEFLK